MKRFALTLVFSMFVTLVFSAGKKDEDPKPLYFDETWGYVSMAKADEYRDDLPLTDVCYFSADVNCYGELISVPKIDAIKVEGKRRHMVFICDSKSLTHFVLDPQYSVREKIIEQLIEAVEPFDGLNIDMELVPARDGNLFLSFVAELRERLSEKILSVCVPARVRRLRDEVYPYAEIAALCDRVFIMAYDEHWSGGVPGPIASPEWTSNVAAYAVKSIPLEKIVMGLPFYGRTWAEKSTSGAWYYETAQKMLTENEVDNLTYENGIPTFSYTTEVKVTGYLNDLYSLWTLSKAYQKVNINKIGYWRIGQEDPAVWDYLLIK